MRFSWRILDPLVPGQSCGDRIETAMDRVSPTWVLAAAMVSLAAIFGIFAFILHASRLDVAAAASTASGNLAMAVSQQLARDIEMLDLSLQDLVEGAGNEDVLKLSPRLQRAVIFDRAAAGHGHGALLWIDADGGLVAQTGAATPRPINVSGEPFFTTQASRPDAGLFVSRPFVSVIDGEASIALSRRITRSGVFAGVGVATIRVSDIQQFFRTLDLGAQGQATLVADDATILVRQPLAAPVFGVTDAALVAHLPPAASGSGQFEMRSPLDGINRMVAAHGVGPYGLTVFIGQSIEDIYAAWWRRAGLTGIAMLLLGGVILALIATLQVALRRRQAAEAELGRVARTDKLTGLANRRRFDETLEGEWERARLQRQSIALLLLDIDHFKAINDRFGHPGGDAVLAAVAACIGQGARGPADLVARYGGEEFAVLLPETGAGEALAVAGRIEACIRDLAQPNPRSSTAVLTVSIGVAALMPAPHEPSGHLVRMADVSLYAAKSAGRNRIVMGSARHAA